MSENFVSTLAPIDKTFKSLLNKRKIVSDVSTSSTSSLTTSSMATTTNTTTSTSTTAISSTTTSSTTYQMPVTTTLRPCKLMF